jgi:CD109 antigen
MNFVFQTDDMKVLFAVKQSFCVFTFLLFRIGKLILPHVAWKWSFIMNLNSFCTRYTYGKAVRGEATVTLYPTYYSGLLQPIFQNPVRKVIHIDGKANVEFDITKDLQ